MHKCLTECLLKIIKAYINTIFGVRITTLIDIVTLFTNFDSSLFIIIFNMCVVFKHWVIFIAATTILQDLYVLLSFAAIYGKTQLNYLKNNE